MNDFLILDPDKLRKARGNRSLRAISEATGGKIRHQSISQWEQGEFRPRPENLKLLLDALGVGFDQVASPFSCTKKAES